MLPFFDGALLRRLVTPLDAAAAISAALCSGRAPGQDPARSGVPVAGGELLLMPASTDRSVGIKLVTLRPGEPRSELPRVQGLYILFDGASLAPVAVLDGIALTALRTPAVSAVATDLLAVREARTLVVFGAGPQAEGHVAALCGLREITRVEIVSRDPERAGSLAARLRANGYPARVGNPASIFDADIVCTTTTSRVPVVDGRLLPAHVHVNAVGSHQPEARELDAETMRQAFIVVETRETAWREAGDLIMARQDGAIGTDAVAADLAELVTGRAAINPEATTVFKSVGMAWQDLAVAELALERS